MHTVSAHGAKPKSHGHNLGRREGANEGREEGRREGYGMNGVVSLGAVADAKSAPELMAEAIKAVQARTGWDAKTVAALITNGYTAEEGENLKVQHASGMRGVLQVGNVVTVGKLANKFDEFFSQFDPTWSKAKFGGAIRSAIVAAASIVGIPAGPIMDQIAAIHVAAVGAGHPHAQPGPLPPIPMPVGLPMVMHGRRKWSTGKKLAAAGAVGVGAYVLYKVLSPRKTNPRRRHRNKRRSRR